MAHAKKHPWGFKMPLADLRNCLLFQWLGRTEMLLGAPFDGLMAFSRNKKRLEKCRERVTKRYQVSRFAQRSE